MKPAHHSRRGSIYLMVMSTVVIVVTLSLTGLAFVRVQRKVAEVTNDMADARANAASGVEYAAMWIAADPHWRTTAATSGGALNAVNIGRSKVQINLADPVDGVLTNTDTDPVDVTSSAQMGQIAQVYKARLTPTQVPLSCLSVGTCVGFATSLTNAVVLGSDCIHSNTSITATAARVQVPAEAALSVSGAAFSAKTTQQVATLQLPDSTAFDYYKSVGTQITSAGMSGRRIENIVLSPQNNPYGTRATNAQGIYWIDCGGDDYTIQNCRIVGTLVLLNCTGNTVVGGGVIWNPVSANLPALLVQGKISFQGTADPVNESTIGVNFNPKGTPYGGQFNGSMTDVYPASINGLVYASGLVSISGEVVIDGVLIAGGRMTLTGSLTVFYSDRYYYNPPPGFRAATVMTLVPGSFERVVY